MNKQEIFNIVWNGIKAQGFRQSVRGTECLYRGPDNTKCALGHLIPDDVYDKSIEGWGARNLRNGIGDAGKVKTFMHDLTKEVDIEFITSLQYRHDVVGTDPVKMESSLLNFAEEHGLKVPE